MLQLSTPDGGCTEATTRYDAPAFPLPPLALPATLQTARSVRADDLRAVAGRPPTQIAPARA